MSRVLLVSHEASRTGAPRVAALVARGLVAQGHQVRIVSQRPGPLLQDFEATAPTAVAPLWRVLRRLWSRPGRVRARFGAVLEVGIALFVVKTRRADLVYVNSTSSSGYVRAARLLRRPAVLHVHESGEVLRCFLDRVGISGLPDARLVACSPSVAEDLVTLGAAPGDVDLLLSIPDSTRVLAEHAAGPARDEERKVVVGCCGAVEHRKGVDLWLEMARAVQEADYEVEFRFIWIGEGSPPPEAASLSDVEFAGHSDDPFAAMAEFDIMTLPSRDDPFPLVVMEAMLLGKPVIAFDVGGVAHQVGDTGVLVEPGDVAGLAREVVRLGGDAVLRDRLGSKAAQRAQAMFSWSTFEAGLADVVGRVS